MKWAVAGLGLALIFTATIATRAERARRARVDLRAARGAVRTTRGIFWSAVAALVRAAVAPLLIGGILLALYLIGRTP